MKNSKGRVDGDRLLGMQCAITRRDFLHGIAGGIAAYPAGSLHASARPAASLQNAPDYYPPSRVGMRGSHPGSFEAAHALRDGDRKNRPIGPTEDYDVVIVGAGISGLSAAHFYRSLGEPGARILILDNHDDVGGHAKRNEVFLEGHMLLMNGGTLGIDSPRPYSAIADGLLRELGVDVKALAASAVDPEFYSRHGMSRAVFFDQETFGADYLAVGVGQTPWPQLLARTPLSELSRTAIARIEAAQIDYLPGLSSPQKKERLAGISYRTFLKDLAGADDKVLAFYQRHTQGEWCVGIDAVSALDCWGIGLPGFQGLQLERGSTSRMGNTAAGYADTGGSYELHLPDGNATIARLLVRSLIPAALAGHSVEDAICSRLDYSRLDGAQNAVRIRLNSLATHVQNTRSDGVRIEYVSEGSRCTARASACVLAGYNMMIPYLVPDLPADQKQALHALVKEPLVYSTVAVRNWRAFKALGVSHVHAPGGYHSDIALNPHVNIGAYASPAHPDEPMLLRMTRAPCAPGLSYDEQNRAGRADLLTTSFETFERNIREQLNRTLASGGFDARRDIVAIMVNRWPHGYAKEYNCLFDPFMELTERPHMIGRRPFGRIFIANSDSGAAAYTDCAIEQGHRAVTEMLLAKKLQTRTALA